MDAFGDRAKKLPKRLDDGRRAGYRPSGALFTGHTRRFADIPREFLSFDFRDMPNGSYRPSEIFTIVSESNQAVLLSVSKNIADHVKVSDHVVQLYEENDFLEEIHYVLFPFEVSSIFSFFDFAPLLNRIFQIEPTGMGFGNIGFPEKVKCAVKHPKNGGGEFGF